VAFEVFETCSHAISGDIQWLDATMARRASHFLVGITLQSFQNREVNPLATRFQFAGIVTDFIHAAE
jgi:hypothetical protein